MPAWYFGVRGALAKDPGAAIVDGDLEPHKGRCHFSPDREVSKDIAATDKTSMEEVLV
jgi:hypothetical protein